MAKNKKASYKKKKQTRNSHVGALALLFFVALIGTCGFLAWKQYESRNQKDDEPVAADSKNINTADLANNIDGKDEVDSGNSSSAKELAEKEEEEREAAQNNTSLKAAEVYIANVGQDGNVIFASGVITNVVNKSGSCTYTFTNGSETITATSEVQPSPKETICGNVDVDASKFSAGEWTVKLNFKSDYAEGESDATSFTVE